MDLNIATANVVPSSTLENQEKFVVDVNGAKTTSPSDFGYGVVSIGRPANEASQIITRGETEAKVDGSGTSLSVGDPLTAGSNGRFEKATYGTHNVRGHVLESASSQTTAQVFLY